MYKFPIMTAELSGDAAHGASVARWARDTHRLAVAHGQRLYVVDPICHDLSGRGNRTCLTLHKTMLPVDTRKLGATHASNANGFPSHQKFVLKLDRLCVGPDVDNGVLESCRGVRDLAWAPASRHDLLCVLTIEHGVYLYTRSAAAFDRVRLNEILDTHLAERPGSSRPSSFDDVRRQMDELAITHVAWIDSQSVLRPDNTESHTLVSASRGGHFYTWRISIDSARQVTAVIGSTWQSGCGRLTCLRSFGDDMVACNALGQMFVVLPKLTDDSSPFVCSELWGEADRIPFSHCEVADQVEDQFLLVAVKQQFIFLFNFTVDRRTSSSQFLKVKNTRFEPAEYCLPVAAMSHHSRRKVMISSLDGSVFEVTVDDNGQIDQQKSTKPVGVYSTNAIVFSLAYSPNSVLGCGVQRLTTLHDTTIRKKCVQFFIYTQPKNTSELINKFDSEVAPDTPFSKVRDYVIALMLMMDRTKNYNDAYIKQRFLTPLANNDVNSLLDAKVGRFLAFAIRKLSRAPLPVVKFKSADVDQLNQAIDNAKLMIYANHCERIISQSSALPSLSAEQLMSLRQLVAWHNANISPPIVLDRHLTADQSPQKCAICDAHVDITDFHSASCVNEHPACLCVNSLIVTDIARQNEHKLCPYCCNYVIVPAVWPGVSNEDCIFCY